MINMPGGPEIAIILVIALIVLGPQQLPKAMRTLGSAMAEIRKLSSGFQAEMRSVMDTIETQGGESTTTSSTSTTTSAAAPATTPDPGVTEVVARNPAVDPAPETTAAAGPTGTADPVASPDGPPPVDPADRAAG